MVAFSEGLLFQDTGRTELYEKELSLTNAHFHFLVPVCRYEPSLADGKIIESY